MWRRSGFEWRAHLLFIPSPLRRKRCPIFRELGQIASPTFDFATFGVSQFQMLYSDGEYGDMPSARRTRRGQRSAGGEDVSGELSASARPFQPGGRGALGVTPFFVPRGGARAVGPWRSKGGGNGGAQRSLDEQIALAAATPLPTTTSPEPHTPTRTYYYREERPAPAASTRSLFEPRVRSGVSRSRQEHIVSAAATPSSSLWTPSPEPRAPSGHPREERATLAARAPPSSTSSPRPRVHRGQRLLLRGPLSIEEQVAFAAATPLPTAPSPEPAMRAASTLDAQAFSSEVPRRGHSSQTARLQDLLNHELHQFTTSSSQQDSAGLQRVLPASEEQNTVALATTYLSELSYSAEVAQQQAESMPRQVEVQHRQSSAPSICIGEEWSSESSFDTASYESSIDCPLDERLRAGDYVGEGDTDEEPDPISPRTLALIHQEDAVEVLARCSMRDWWHRWVVERRIAKLRTERKRMIRLACLRDWQRVAQRERQSAIAATMATSRYMIPAFDFWRRETHRVRKLNANLTHVNHARALYRAQQCWEAWRRGVALAANREKLVHRQTRRVKRNALHGWASAASIPELTPNQWATLRRHLRRLSGDHKAISAITWWEEARPTTVGGETQPRKIFLCQVASADHHADEMRRTRLNRRELEITSIPVNRPARLAQLGVDIEDVLWAVRRTHFPTGQSRPKESRSSKSRQNQYDALMTGESTTEESEEDTTPTSSSPSSPSPRVPATRTPRITQRERAARVQDLLEKTRIREECKRARKLRKVEKRKQAKLRRRGSSGGGGTSSDSPSSASETPSTPSDALTEECSHSSDSVSRKPKHSRKGGRQRKRGASARRDRLHQAQKDEHQLQLEELEARMQRCVLETVAKNQALAQTAHAEEVARHEQQLRELQRITEEQRQQLDQAARDRQSAEQQVLEGRSVLEAALQAVEARAHNDIAPPTSATPTPSSAPAPGSLWTSSGTVTAPGSTVTIDVREANRGVSFGEDTILGTPNSSAPSDADAHCCVAKLDWRSISVPAVTAIRALVLEHGTGRGRTELMRLFHQTAKMYRDLDLASGTGPPVSTAPASELDPPPLAGVAVIHHLEQEVGTVSTSRPCARCSRSPSPPVAIWDCVLTLLPGLTEETSLQPLCIYCTRGVWPGAFDNFPAVNEKPAAATVIETATATTVVTAVASATPGDGGAAATVMTMTAREDPATTQGGGMDMTIMTSTARYLTSLVDSVAAAAKTMEAVATRTMTTMGPPITAMARVGDPPAMMVGSSGRSTCDTPAR